MMPEVLLSAQTLAEARSERIASEEGRRGLLAVEGARAKLSPLSALSEFVSSKKESASLDEKVEAFGPAHHCFPVLLRSPLAPLRAPSLFFRAICASPFRGPGAQASPARARSPSECPWRERTPSPACERSSGGQRRRASRGSSGWLPRTVRSFSSSLGVSRWWHCALRAAMEETKACARRL